MRARHRDPPRSASRGRIVLRSQRLRSAEEAAGQALGDYSLRCFKSQPTNREQGAIATRNHQALEFRRARAILVESPLVIGARSQWRPTAGRAGWRGDRAMAPACREARPLADGVARRRVRVFVNICTGFSAFCVARARAAVHRRFACERIPHGTRCATGPRQSTPGSAVSVRVECPPSVRGARGGQLSPSRARWALNGGERECRRERSPSRRVERVRECAIVVVTRYTCVRPRVTVSPPTGGERGGADRGVSDVSSRA